LFAARDRTAPSPESDWRDLCPALQVIDTTGSHATMLDPPHVADLARALAEILKSE
jgi:thioesterase domain-containing protein